MDIFYKLNNLAIVGSIMSLFLKIFGYYTGTWDSIMANLVVVLIGRLLLDYVKISERKGGKKHGN